MRPALAGADVAATLSPGGTTRPKRRVCPRARRGPLGSRQIHGPHRAATRRSGDIACWIRHFPASGRSRRAQSRSQAAEGNCARGQAEPAAWRLVHSRRPGSSSQSIVRQSPRRVAPLGKSCTPVTSRRLMLRLVRLIIRGYQLTLRPVLLALGGPGAGCRYVPGCSTYFLQACEVHGIPRGSWLGLKRICRCHPWGGSGPDPVPPATSVQRPHYTRCAP